MLTGIDAEAEGERIYKNVDGTAAAWVGVIDEVWQMGKPVGVGGPWHESQVAGGEPYDPY